MDTPYGSVEPFVGGGTVISYAPTTKFYTITVDGKGTKTARAMFAGVLKPYEVGARIVVCRLPGFDWTIMGEVDGSPVTPNLQADTDLERVISAASVQQSPISGFTIRPVDTSGQPESPVNPSDVRIETRTKFNIARAFIHLFRFGDIKIQASNLCFVHLARLRNKLIVRARDLHAAFLGARAESITDNTGKTRTTVDILSKIGVDPVISTISGDVDEGDGIVNGHVMTAGGLRMEYDSDTGTYRAITPGASMAFGSLAAERAGHPVSGQPIEGGVPSDSDDGLVIVTGDTKIEVYPESVKISRGNAHITLDTDVTTQVGTTKWVLKDGGVELTSESIKISADNSLEFNSPKIAFTTGAAQGIPLIGNLGSPISPPSSLVSSVTVDGKPIVSGLGV